MLPDNNITKLLGLEDIFVNEVENHGVTLKLHVTTAVREQRCPCCQAENAVFSRLQDATSKRPAYTR